MHTSEGLSSLKLLASLAGTSDPRNPSLPAGSKDAVSEKGGILSPRNTRVEMPALGWRVTVRRVNGKKRENQQ